MHLNLFFFVVELILTFFFFLFRFIKVANETMCRPIRALTEGRGHAISKHVYAYYLFISVP